MAQNYTRQSAFSDGDTITATLFNDEYNQLVNTFTYSSSDASATGHRHDGSTGEGGNIYRIGDLDFLNKIEADSSNNRWGFWVEVSSIAVEQLRIQDGAIVPVTDNDIDLGTSSLEFKNLYLDGTAKVDALVVDETATITGAATLSSTLGVTGATTLSSTLAVTGAATLSSDLTVTGNTTLGNAATDTVTITADVNSNIIPSADSTYTLGDSSNYWSAGYIDAITTTGNVSVGGNLTVTGNATISGNLTFGDADTDTVSFSADVSSHILPDVDDTYDLGSSTKEWRNLYVDGTANIDSLVADTADINGGTIDGAIIATSDVTVGAGKTLDVSAGTLTLADNQISGDKVEGGTIAATTITSLASTTVDTTNIEVTNLKAKDGTAAGSIADTTGVVTLASSVLTTTDINGGTIDGTTIATSDITVGAGKTLDVSAGTFTVANDQISGDAINGGTATPTNLTVSGTTSLAGASTTADITFGDNDKAIFGAGSDLQIYHSGTHSFISDQGTGNMLVLADNFEVNSASNTANKITAATGGAVTLFHNNSAKLATTATGIDVTGTVTADGLVVNDASFPTGMVKVKQDSDATRFRGILLEANANDSLLAIGYNNGKFSLAPSYNTTGSFEPLSVFTSNLERLTVDTNGDISFYEDTGTTPKFFWDASAERLGLGTTSPAELLDVNGHINLADGYELKWGGAGATIYGSNSNNQLRLYTNNTERMRISAAGELGLGVTNTTGGSGDINMKGNQAIRWMHATDGTQYGDIYVDTSDNMVFRNTSSSTERMRIDSAGNVGIGVVPKAGGTTWQHVQFGGTGNLIARFSDSTVDASFANNQYVNASNVDSYIATGAAARMLMNDNVISFDQAASGTADTAISWSEAMRIDSSGNLLVGKTAVDNSVVGVTASGGQLSAVCQDAAPLFGNRTNSDGDIALFRKDNSTVGSIAYQSHGLQVNGETDHTGISFDAFAHVPLRNAARVDNTVSLGTSTYRFKDLYLSGGVYLGGTGAANLLDDYEEGTWTPTLTGVSGGSGQTYTTQTGSYVKIGDVIVLTFVATLSAKGSMTGLPVIGGIPFVGGSTSSYNRNMDLWWDNLNISPYSIGYFARGGNFAQFYLAKLTAAGAPLTFAAGNGDFTDTSSISGTIVYRLSA